VRRVRLIVAALICAALAIVPVSQHAAAVGTLFEETCLTAGCVSDFISACDDAGGVTTGSPAGGGAAPGSVVYEDHRFIQ
jgi:hypothetical protein